MKNILKRHWPLLALGLLLAWVGFYLIRSGKEEIKDYAIEAITPEEGIKIHDFRFDQNNPEKGMTWVLTAKEMRSSRDNNFLSFDGFHIKVTPKDRPLLELSGDKGTYARDSGEIKLWGNLEGISADGFKLITEEILINEKEKQATTDKPIEILGPFYSIHGQGLVADLEQETMKILSNVTTIINWNP